MQAHDAAFGRHLPAIGVLLYIVLILILSARRSVLYIALVISGVLLYWLGGLHLIALLLREFAGTLVLPTAEQ